MKTKKMRIAIAGIGGIGGYIGGKLAHHYQNSQNIEIAFITKGENYEFIRENGIELRSKGIVYQCKPVLTAKNPTEIGEIDVFIICTKNFSVLALINQYRECLTANATIITTQNTVNGKEMVSPYLPNGMKLMEGSIYIASNSSDIGKIEHHSGPAKFIFGTDGEKDENAISIVKILNDAGIDATYSMNIKSVLWKKFMFVSPAAIVTALFDIPFSGIRKHLEPQELYITLISELLTLAKAKNIPVESDTILNNLNILANFDEGAKSSFQLDLEKNKPTEIDSLVKYVINEAKLFQIHVPNYAKAIIRLKEIYGEQIE